jgi:hypothetical protein
MNSRRTGGILVALVVTILSVGLLWGASRLIFATEGPKRITIIYTNDTLGTVLPCG